MVTRARINTLLDLVPVAAAQAGDDVAIVEEDGATLTWAGLDDAVTGVAAGLGALGVVAGQRVVLALGNRTEFVVAYLGVLRAHAVAVPVNPRSTPGELAHVVTDCAPRAVVAEQATTAMVTAALAEAAEAEAAESEARQRGGPVLVGVDADRPDGWVGWQRLLDDGAAATPPPAVHDPESLAALLYTSGTSGRPRGAMLTHRALLANIEQVAAVDPPMIGPSDVVLGVLPLFHVYGLNAVLGGVLRQQARLVLQRSFAPEGTLDLVAEHACTVVPVAPPVFAHWLPLPHLAERLASVRLLLSGSAPLPIEKVEQFADRTDTPVHEGYGLTEAAPVVTSTLCRSSGDGDPAPKPGSVGAALPGIDVRILDDDARPPEGTDAGEIHIRGENLFSGYWPTGADGPVDGWFATGDVGYLDPDGDLFLVDRVKELIIVSGFNVYPSEVEEVLTGVEGVAEAAVVGAPDPITGESVVAYVVAAPGFAGDDLIARIERRCSLRLARFKRPTRVEVVDELPFTATGKVQKGRLRAAERRRLAPLLEG